MVLRVVALWGTSRAIHLVNVHHHMGSYLYESSFLIYAQEESGGTTGSAGSVKVSIIIEWQVAHKADDLGSWINLRESGFWFRTHFILFFLSLYFCECTKRGTAHIFWYEKEYINAESLSLWRSEEIAGIKFKRLPLKSRFSFPREMCKKDAHKGRRLRKTTRNLLRIINTMARIIS